jgi:hypothetical protein
MVKTWRTLQGEKRKEASVPPRASYPRSRGQASPGCSWLFVTARPWSGRHAGKAAHNSRGSRPTSGRNAVFPNRSPAIGLGHPHGRHALTTPGNPASSPPTTPKGPPIRSLLGHAPADRGRAPVLLPSASASTSGSSRSLSPAPIGFAPRWRVQLNSPRYCPVSSDRKPDGTWRSRIRFKIVAWLDANARSHFPKQRGLCSHDIGTHPRGRFLHRTRNAGGGSI